ncbi:MAG: metallophosphoesterase family protein [Anaeromyxobacteraceae bacterium]
MRILCLSDVHADVGAARRLGATTLTGGIELVVSAGDLGLDGANDRAVYEAIGKGSVPVLSVPGNHDGDAAYDALVAARDRKFVDRGSVQLANWIRERQPLACVCGHVHHKEAITEKLGATTVINAGPHGWVLRL